ncbi:MAG: asparagine synthase (glutamine-hydrolyzing) [Phycisphaerales bacterium]
MCGIAGVVCAGGRQPSLSDEAAARWRDLLARRGPDGAGLYRRRNALLLHRRLSIIDPSPAGAQPMLSDPVLSPRGGPAEPRFALVYNGMLYNDAEVRAELSRRGVRFRSSCDTETVLRAFEVWGTEALRRFRGMFALALYDALHSTLLLARDPVGIKPLYYHADARQVVFASEPWAVAAHPEVPHRPDHAMMTAYLSTIRTVLGDRTLFEGVRAVRPGEVVLCDLDGESPTLAHGTVTPTPARVDARDDESHAASLTRDAVEESVSLHLRADVPTCCLLSGGLDSTITATLASRRMPGLRTYCAGAPLPCECSDTSTTGDLSHARRVANELGTRHAEAHVTSEMFFDRWGWMVDQLGSPLSTPNEVAIWAIASRLRADGCVVTVSGEGADELFGGYEGPMRAAMACVEAVERGAAMRPSDVDLDEAAWVPPSALGAVADEDFLRRAGGEAALRASARAEFDRSIRDVGGYAAQAHLRHQQRVNLVGLLQRLDTATMLAGVEGRTPYADLRVMEMANAMPMSCKFALAAPALVGSGADDVGAGGVAAPARTKIALRRAFEDVVSNEVIDRPKASFPLPFREWLGGPQGVALAGSLLGTASSSSFFSDAARALVAKEPGQLWRFAWPMMNLAMWSRRF